MPSRKVLKNMCDFYIVSTGEIIHADERFVQHVVFKNGRHALKYEGEFGTSFKILSQCDIDEACERFGKARRYRSKNRC